MSEKKLAWVAIGFVFVACVLFLALGISTGYKQGKLDADLKCLSDRMKSNNEQPHNHYSAKRKGGKLTPPK